MNASQFIRIEHPKITANMFILSNQLYKKIAQLAVSDPGSDTLKDQLPFSRVYSTPDTRHEEIMNLLKNIHPEKIKLNECHDILVN